jgi:hypothetical protein
MGIPVAVEAGSGVCAVILLSRSLDFIDVGCREGGCEAGMHAVLLSLWLFTASRMSCDTRAHIGKTEPICGSGALLSEAIGLEPV